MARRKKQIQTSPASNVSKETFLEFLGDVDNTKQKISDAQMANGRLWKRTDSLGIHADAAKLTQKLAKMSDEKRADFLLHFDKYRAFMDFDCDAQLDLLEDAVEEDVEEGVEQPLPLAAADDVDREDDGPDEIHFEDGEERVVDGDPMIEETAVEWEEAPVLDDDEENEALDSSGTIFLIGKEAGLGGAEAEDNPHEEGCRAFEIWERGRAVGARSVDAQADVQAEASAIADELDDQDEREEQDADLDEEVEAGSTVVSLFGGEDEVTPPPAAGATGGAHAPTAA